MRIQPQPPFSPGFEVSGEILELGVGVEELKIGDRVIAMTPHGGYAEQVVADSNRCVQMPATMSWQDGTAFPVVFGTSHIALWHRARLQAGETLVVHGASGGVGLTAVAIGKRLGATADSYTHLRAHETVLDLVCRLLLEKKKTIVSNGFLHAFSYFSDTPLLISVSAPALSVLDIHTLLINYSICTT